MDDIDHIKLLADQIKGLGAHVESITDDSMKELCAFFLDDAVNRLSDLQKQRPQVGSQVNRLALSFASLATCLAGHYAHQIKEHEESRRRGAEIANAQHGLAVGVAQAMAQREWEKDARQAIRIGEMCEKVWSSMIDAGYQDFMPDKQAGLKDWIKPVAPAYATKPGRPKKSP